MGKYLCYALYLKRLLVFSLISDSFLIKDILKQQQALCNAQKVSIKDTGNKTRF